MLLDPDSAPSVDDIYGVLESDEPVGPLSSRLRAAVQECGARWPADNLPDSDVDSPWASWPLAGDSAPPVIEVNIRWEHASVMLPALLEIAERHEIVLYDPQQDEIHLPPRLR